MNRILMKLFQYIGSNDTLKVLKIASAALLAIKNLTIKYNRMQMI